jgi:hypothetical protein
MYMIRAAFIGQQMRKLPCISNNSNIRGSTTPDMRLFMSFGLSHNWPIDATHCSDFLDRYPSHTCPSWRISKHHPAVAADEYQKKNKWGHNYMCRPKNIDEFIISATQLKTRVQSMLTRKKQHTHKNSIVVFKTTEHFERYVSGIIHKMEI